MIRVSEICEIEEWLEDSLRYALAECLLLALGMVAGQPNSRQIML